MIIILTLVHHSLKLLVFVHFQGIASFQDVLQTKQQSIIHYSQAQNFFNTYTDVRELSCGRALTPNLTPSNTKTGSTRRTQIHKNDLRHGKNKTAIGFGRHFFQPRLARSLWRAVSFSV